MLEIQPPTLDTPLTQVSGVANPLSQIMVDVVAAGMRQQLATSSNETGFWQVTLDIPIFAGAVTIEARAIKPPCPDFSDSVTVVLPPAPGFRFTAIDVQMGTAFRTVVAQFTYDADPAIAGVGTAYYLLLKPGLPPPTAAEIIGYNDQVALADGTAARGQFAVTIGAPQTPTRVLPGREVPAPFPDETGVVDGYRYDLYMVATLGGLTSDVTSPDVSALGMPFNDGDGSAGTPFGLREISIGEMVQWPDLLPGHPINRAGVTETARMLDNIEGMLVLFEATTGLYGLDNTLGDAYLLRTGFDLSGYTAAYNGAGWRPVGNQNATLSGSAFPHIFTGTLDTDGPLRVIANLPISQTPSNPGVVAYAGLFGLAANAAIHGFEMIGANVSAQVSDGFDGHVGVLAGELFQCSTLINIDNATVAAQGTGMVDVGGMAGSLLDPLDCSDIAISRVTLSATGSVDSSAGGVAGRLITQTANPLSIQGIIVTQAQFTSAGAAGGVLGRLILAAADASVTVTFCTATGSVAGTAFVGGLIGILGGDPARTPSACVVSNCTASAAVQGIRFVGGLLGDAERVTIETCSVLSGSIADASATQVLSRPFGGLIGTLQEGNVADCHAAIDVLIPLSSRVGGLIGDLIVSPATTAFSIANSTASGNVSGVSFVGGLVGGYTTSTAAVLFTSCSASGTVTGSDTVGSASVGGLVGSGLQAVYTDCFATGNVRGRTNVGGLIGDSSAAATFVGCYARGSVTGSGSSVAGFAGAAIAGTFARCFATGNVVATSSNAGGFVSNFINASTITDCYATGNVQATGNAAGLVQAISQGSSILRCYAFGQVVATAAAGGVVAAGSSGSNPVSACFALNPLVAAGGSSVVGRVAASASSLVLTNNSAISTLVLTRGGVPFTPTPGPNTKDGATVTLANLAAAMQGAGWSASVWDFSTIPSLGRPLLQVPRET